MRKSYRFLPLIAVAALAVTACSEDPAGVGDEAERGQTGSFGIVLEDAQDGSLISQNGALSSLRAVDDGLVRSRIDLDDVDHINLPIGLVEAKQDDGPWMEAGRVDATIDLLNLPPGGIEILDSSLPLGEYEKLRLFLTAQPTITLNSSVQVGQHTFEPGDHPLAIPSSENNGVRLHVDFEVDAEGETLTIVFDGRATLRKVVATGSGMLKISPELKVRNDEGDEVGELDDDGFEVEGPVTGVDPDAGTFTVDDDGEEVTVVVDDGTEFEGDFATLDEVEAALMAGDPVEAEAEGTLQGDGSLLADEVEFEID